MSFYRNITPMPENLMVSASKECATRREKEASINWMPSMSTTFCSGRGVTLGKIKSNVLSTGRFFASNELKTMLAYVLLNYGVKMASGNQRSRDWSFGETCLPDPSCSENVHKVAWIWLIRRVSAEPSIAM